MTGKRFFYLTLFALFLASCGVNITDYYPLKEGMSWEYRIDKSQTQDIENFAPRDMGGIEVIPQKIENSAGTAFHFVTKDKDGIYTYAYQAPSATEPKVLPEADYILKNPLKPGKSWEESASVQLLLESIPYAMVYLVESKSETVTVPAGTFENCLLIKGSGLAQSDKGALGIIKISITEDNWYAPGVGLVKSVRKQSGNHVLAGSGETLVQLLSWKK